MTRRAFLAALGGTIAAACREREPPLLEGGIVGANQVRGHLLREPARPRADHYAHCAVAIVGGGMAGLSAAWTLAHAGVDDFRVLELEAEAGGTSRSGQGPVSPYPWGAHYVPVPSSTNHPLRQLLSEVGAIRGHDAAGRAVWSEEALCREPVERLFYRGEWHEGLYPRVGASANDRTELARFEQRMGEFAGYRDDRGRRGFALPRASGSDDADLRALDALSMADWLRREGFRSDRLRWWVEYGMRDDFGATLEQVSAWAGVHYFASRHEDADAESAAYLTWPEGNGRLAMHLARVAGPRLSTDALVVDIAPEPGGVAVTYLDAAGAVRGVRARHVVFALPRFLAAPIIAPWRSAPPAFVTTTQYGAWLVANLTLDDRPAVRGFPLAWDNVIYGGEGLGYVVATHQLGSDYGPTVLTYYLPLTSDNPRRDRERLLATSWQAWVDQVFADLRPAHPDLPRLTRRIDLYRWGHAMVRPSPGLLWSDDLVAAARPLGNIHFAHTDLSGIALAEEAQYHGVRAAVAILDHLGHAKPAWA